MLLPKIHDRTTHERISLIFLLMSPGSLGANIQSTEAQVQASALLDGMQNRVSQLDANLAATEDEKKRHELELKKASLEKALEARKSTINSPEQLADAIDQIHYDLFLLGRLETGDFDHVDLSFLMQSDLFPYFDDAAQGKLAETYQQMENRDLISETLRPGSVHIQQVPGEKRREVGFPKLLNIVSPEIVDKLKLTLAEACFIRTERIHEYLTKGYEEVLRNIERIKQEGILSPKAVKALEKEYEEAKKILIAENTDPKLLAKAAEDLPGALIASQTSREEMEALKVNRPAVEAKIKDGHSRLKKTLHELTPDRASELLKKYQAESGEKTDSAIFRKATRALNELSDPNSEIRKHVAEFEDLLPHLSTLPPEEVRQIQIELEPLLQKLDLLENPGKVLKEAGSPDNQSALKAHTIIRELERATNPQDLKAILEERLGAEHLQTVPHAEYEKNYRQFSEEGDMVFQEKGNQWKIIIDESVLSDPSKTENLKKQLTHELLHLEFEKGKNVKAKVRKALVETNPEQWQKIRKAYIELAKSKNRKPPHGEEWEDDDILSELYAMHDEIGRTRSKGNSLTDKLNNLLVDAGVGSLIPNIQEKTRAYEEGAKETVRAYQAGGGEGEGGEDVDAEAKKPVKPKSKGEAIYKKNADDIDTLRDRMHTLKQSEYLGEVAGAAELLAAMDSYNNATAGLNSDAKNDPTGEVIATAVSARIKKVTDDLNDVEDRVSKAARKAPNTEMGILRRLWLNTKFLSIGDFVQLGKDVYEFYQRRHKRVVGDHAAHLGMALFSGTDLGREALARKYKVEHEEVEQWKSRYNHLDAWHLYDELRELASSANPDADQLKAILQILASKGRLNWRNQDLWKALNKLQTAVHLKPGDPMLMHDPVLLGQRMMRALGEVFHDYDQYITLERQQGTTYTSEKQKYDPVHNRMQDKLTDRSDELLAQHRAGEHVDPILYESILEYCIKNGKSYAENVMFHLIAGMAEGLLAPDRGLALGTLLNTWPPIDWFTSRKPPYSTADWKKFCEKKFPKSFKAGTVLPDFKNFFWTEVQNNHLVIERVKKSVGERAWDHDWARSIACLGDANTAKRFLSGRSGQEETKATAVGNAYTGAVQWLEENAKNPDFATRESFARMTGWIAMSEGILNRTAYQSKDKDINTRATESMNRDIPRESPVSNHPGASTGENRRMASQILFMLDAPFFSIFSGREALTDEQKRELGTRAAQYIMQRYPSIADRFAEVTTIDQIYDRIDLIITTMFEQMSEAQFQGILRQLGGAR